MKNIIIVSAVVLAVVAFELVSSHGGFPFFGGKCENRDFSSSSSEEESIRCQCGSGRRNPCSRNASTYQLGCRGTNQYLLCSNRTCSNRTCDSNQVWNSTLGACAQCLAGFHVSAKAQRCVCNQGTRFNCTTGQCSPCPTGATVEADRCYCPNTTVYDRLTNACRACPAQSNQTREGCRCSKTTFWNAVAWQCQDCPGVWVNQTRGVFSSRLTQKCVCNGTNQIFYQPTVTCFTCPTNTTASRTNDACLCGNFGSRFNYTSGQCGSIRRDVWDI